MIGTIRKHSSWLWWVVAGLTIVSFVIFMGQGGSRYGGGSGNGLGTIYGKAVTQEDLTAAEREYKIDYWRRSGHFPDNDPNFTPFELKKEAYVRMMLKAKAQQLGIQISQDQQVNAANEFLSRISPDHRPVPMKLFIEKILTPENLTVEDFERFIIDDLEIDQLTKALGLPGALISPQEASELYDRENREYSAQAVFFSATNFLSQVQVTPNAISQFYTNYMAAYRLPERLEVNYVKYDLSNYLTAAEAKIGKTNLDAQANSIYLEHGAEAAPDAKTPEEAKAKIRELIIRQAGAKAAMEDAMKLVTPLFAMDPPLPDNLVTVTKKQGLTVHTTAPFDEEDGPSEFIAPSDLVKAMFSMTPDSPYVPKPVLLADGVYVIGLKDRLPSAIQPLSDIRNRVMEDYKSFEATMKARAAGTNFYISAMVQMAAGQTFAQVALKAGQAPVALKPFSLNSREIPEAEGHADVRQVLNTAFSTQPGHVSQFVDSNDGGFVLYVQSLLPVDLAEKNKNLPAFEEQLRRSRENEAFNLWLEAEASRELAKTPILDEMKAQAQSRR